MLEFLKPSKRRMKDPQRSMQSVTPPPQDPQRSMESVTPPPQDPQRSMQSVTPPPLSPQDPQRSMKSVTPPPQDPQRSMQSVTPPPQDPQRSMQSVTPPPLSPQDPQRSMQSVTPPPQDPQRSMQSVTPPPQDPQRSMESLSQSELLTLLSVLEGELEARDLVIQTLRAQHRDLFVQERYGKFSLSDPFLALQRDGEALGGCGLGEGGRGLGGEGGVPPHSNPLAVLKMVVSHCRRMQDKMMDQLNAAESRHRRVIADLEEERRRHAEDTAEGDDVTYILEKERERLLQQLSFERAQGRRQRQEREEERAQQRRLSTTLAKECEWASSRALEEGRRLAALGLRLEREREEARALRAQLEEERGRARREEARAEERLAERDAEREGLRRRLRREEARGGRLREEKEALRRRLAAAGCREEEEKEEEEEEEEGSQLVCSPTEVNGHHGPLEGQVQNDGPPNCALLPPGPASTPASTSSTPASTSSTTTPNSAPAPPFTPAPTPVAPAAPASPTQSLSPCATAPSSLPLSPCSSPLLPRPSPSLGPTPILGPAPNQPNYQSSYQAGIHQRFHAARHKFQGQTDPNPEPPAPLVQQQPPQGLPPLSPGEACPSPGPSPSPEPSPPSGRQQARSTVTQALSRFTAQQGAAKTPANSSPFGTDYRNLAPPSSPIIGRASAGGSGGPPPPLGLRSPTVPPRADRGNPPPLPPKKPGLAQSPGSPGSPGSPVPGARDGHFPELTASCGLTSTQEGVKELDMVVSSTS